jgi:hypothetical protein
MAKEKLEKLYSPLLGYLHANEDIWNNFKGNIYSTRNNPLPYQDMAGQVVIQEIIAQKQPANVTQDLRKWVHVMEGAFRSNNESAEQVIVRNLAFLTSADAVRDSDFDKARREYLLHVGEFKSILIRWKEDRSVGNSPPTTTDAECWKYYHPENLYPTGFLGKVIKSKDELETVAGLK